MQLIKITDNILVNPEEISIIEFVVIDGNRHFVITVSDRQIVSNISANELLQSLIKVGIEPHSQFWAG